MAYNFNGVELDSVTFIGVELDSVTFNGVLVFTGITNVLVAGQDAFNIGYNFSGPYGTLVPNTMDGEIIAQISRNFGGRFSVLLEGIDVGPSRYVSLALTGTFSSGINPRTVVFVVGAGPGYIYNGNVFGETSYSWESPDDILIVGNSYDLKFTV